MTVPPAANRSGTATITVTVSDGAYRVVAYARSSLSGGFTGQRSVDITVTAPVPTPAMALDRPAPGATTGPAFTVAGWAVDRGAPSSTGVDAIHVYAYPVINGAPGTPEFLGVATIGLPRPDVARVFGAQFENSGFSLSVSNVAPGAYRVVVYAHSTVTGTFNSQRAADVVIVEPTPNPLMSLDGPQDGATVQQPFITGGWAIDLGAEGGTGVDAVHVWAFPIVNDTIGAGQFVDAALVGGARTDVGAAFGGQFTNSGFNFLMHGLAPGQYIIGAYARSTVSGTFNQVRFARITVTR